VIAAARYADRDRREWDAFVERARNGHFVFQRAYLEYHRDRFEDASLLFRDAGRLVAVLPAHRSGRALCSHDGLPFGGLLTSERLRLARVADVFDALRRFARETGLAALRYRPLPHPYQRIPAEEDLFALHRAGAALADSQVRAFLRLGAPPGPTKKRREQLSRARRAGVVVQRSKEFGAFMDLCAEFLRWRHGAAPVHERAEMELLAARFPERIRLYVATRAGEMEAGLVVYCQAPCSRVQYVATTPEGRRFAALDALYAHVARAVPDLGAWLDLGTSTDPATGALSAGLQFYKESLGARSVLQHTYVLGGEEGPPWP
jgi:hypothetical protein